LGLSVASEIGLVYSETEQLFLSLAEQMKVPLLQIARQAEAGILLGSAAETLAKVHTEADIALKLVDGYMLSMRLASQEHDPMSVGPVSVSAMLYDTAQQLGPIAKMYGVTLEVEMAGKYGPVEAHQQGVKAALVSLGYALIEALPAGGGQPKQMRLQLVAHRCRYGIATGLYSNVQNISVQALKKGHQLRGTARQPLPGMTHSGGAGVFVADAILKALGSHLRVSHYHNRTGLGTILQPNPQLQLV
jgi:hypothetical protein